MSIFEVIQPAERGHHLPRRAVHPRAPDDLQISVTTGLPAAREHRGSGNLPKQNQRLS
jgi:hypothetical protein